MSGIDKYLEVIKNGVFGREVRQAIHDGIQQAYTDATIEHGNTDMEVAKARGTEATLGDRLDKISVVATNSEIPLSRLSQEVKEAMTGGSVAVVGPNSTGTVNLIDNAVTPAKTSFINTSTGKNIWHDALIDKIGYNLNDTNGALVVQEGLSVSKLIALPAGTWTLYSFRRIIKYQADGTFIETLVDNGTAKTANTYTFTEPIYLKVSAYSGSPFSNYLSTAYIANEATFSGYEKYNENHQLKNEIMISRSNTALKEFPNLKATLLYGNININTAELQIECSQTLLLMDDAGNFYNLSNVGNVNINGYWSAKGTNFILIRNNSVFVASSNTLFKDDVLLGIVYNGKFREQYGSNLTVDGVASDSRGTWSGLKWVSFGDSITQNGLWQQLVIEETGLTHINMGISSSTIVDYSKWATPMCSDERLDAIPEDTKLLTIMGGTNDWAGHKPIGTIDSEDKSEYFGAYNYIIKKLLAKIPNARIILMTPPFASYTQTTGIRNSIGLTTRDYGNAVKELGIKYNLPVIDTLSLMGANEYNYLQYFGDEEIVAHPNARGRGRLAGILTAYLKSLEEL
ncbi:TPA: SGNH/GDSL hydrolase family protein [Streptococcus suis]